MSDPFSSAFLTQLKEKEKAASAPPPPPPKDQPPLDMKEVKDSKGRLIQRFPLKEGKVHGVMEIFNPNTGALTYTMPFIEGVVNGTLTAYGPDQRVIQEIPYVAGQKKGVAHIYQNGSPTAIITYDHDQMNGEFKAFDRQQHLVHHCFYLNGVLDGPSKLYYPSGKVLEECVYEKNRVTGQQTRYFEDGKPMKRFTYNTEGKLIKEETFSPKGDVTVKDVDPTASTL